MSTQPIPLCVPSLGEDEARRIADCLASTFVSSVGPFVTEFEQTFAAAVGSPHAIACSTGTAALHLALTALGIGRGDRVAVSDCSFIASANPVRYCGAEPVFIDSEAASWNMDPARLEEAIADGEGTGTPIRAVILVHVLGQPADAGPILDLCRRQGIALIEDAAEALGARWLSDHDHAALRGRQVGCVGDVGCFSFNGNKLITTGGGGMCTTADADLAHRLKHLSTQAKTEAPGFVHDAVGFNYRLPNLNAALGLAQLERLDDLLAAKRRIAERYRAALPWTWQEELPGSRSSHWLASALVGDQRDALIDRLDAQGIIARPLWLPISRQPPYRDCRRYGGAVSDRIAAEGIALPCSCDLSEADQERVIDALQATRVAEGR